MDISSLKKALLNPELYLDHPQAIGICETHISLVFLTGNYAYKVKKPVNFGFLDFTSIDKRKYYCEQEVTLNLRLAPTLYLGVIRITEEDNRIVLDGKGRAIEYAVKMRQIPEGFLMNRLLEKKEVTSGMIEAISEKLVRFYFTAETSNRIKSFAKPERVKQDTDENFEQTEKYIDVTISGDVYQEVKEKTDQFYRTKEKVFYQRIKEDRIRDCHGDLRLEHIFWGEEISIFDCIEFNERFRYTDVTADIAFLAMDLDYHSREDLSEHLIQAYIGESGDYELMELLDFYKCYRAYVRGKVESFRLDDPNIPEEEKKEALKRARKYFDLAHRYSQKF
ncbi:MAG: gluconokinase [Thermodesulfobacteriota bacterium]|nr:gluconokinase [Thermodesulfobacteriota bacterium]